jgi:hypothetical protein
MVTLPPENHLPQVSNPQSKKEIHHGRQITEVRSQTGDPEAVQGLRCRQKEAAVSGSEAVGEQESVERAGLESKLRRAVAWVADRGNQS